MLTRAFTSPAVRQCVNSVALSCAASNQLRKNNTGNGKYHKGIICIFAGFLALSALNLLLVIILGTQHNPGQSSHMKGQNQNVQQSQAVPLAGQTYGTAPATTQGYGTTTTVV